MSDQITTSSLNQAPDFVPSARQPAGECLAMLRARRERVYVAVEMPEKATLRIGDKLNGLSAGGWMIVMTNGRNADHLKTVLARLTEKDAKARAAALNTPQAATGFHRWD
jgi:hypothetical protein